MATPSPPSPRCTKEELVAKLKEGPEAWNEWRRATDPRSVISRMFSHLREDSAPPEFLDLTEVNLAEMTLRERQLNFVDFSGADLSGADMEGSRLSFSKFKKAHLARADLRSCDLSFADFQEAQLPDANLQDAELEGANLSHCDLSRAILQNAKLSEARLKGAKLPNSTFNAATLTKADLRLADLRGANLSECKLASAKLRGANLSRANLSKSELQHARLAKSDLRGADLRGADLSYAELTGAKIGKGTLLAKAIFKDANLYKTGLAGANLQEANFNGAKVLGAEFREALLRGADLSNTQAGLVPSQLVGADLTGAKLPEPINKLYEKLGSVSEISDSAKKLFLALLAACLYSWLTIATTKDVDLITNRASSPLPIIQTAIPIVAFYVVTPIILLSVYFYFHFYLQKLWEELAHFPAIFPDGKPLHQRTDPWLFNDLVRAHFSRLRKDRPFLSHFQQWTSILLAWGLVPITLLIFWTRYLPRHGKYGTYFHAAVFALCTVAAVRLYLLARRTLRGKERLSVEESVKHPGPYAGLAIAALIVIAMLKISNLVIYGTPYSGLPWALDRLGYSPFASLENADVSIKPPNWLGKKDEELDQVKGANLDRQDLRYAVAPRAFLAKAQLMGANLQGSLFAFADLRQANLITADLKGAQFTGADLGEANLSYTGLNEVSLIGANLSGAQLTGADLAGVRVGRLYRLGAPPQDTKLRYADLRSARGLTPASMRACADWQLAFFDSDMLRELGLPSDHNDALQAYLDSKSQEDFDSWQIKWHESKSKASANSKPK